MGKVVYIAGPITGVKTYREAFAAVEAELTAEGYTALNPAHLPETLDNGKALSICLAMLEQADAVFVLPNWAASRGAALEVSYSTYLRKPVFSTCEELKEVLHP